MNRVTNFPRFLSGFFEIERPLLLDAYVGNLFQPFPGQHISIGNTGNPFDNIVSNKLFNENGLLQVNSLESSFVPLGIALDDGVATASFSIDDNSLVVVDNKLSVKSVVSIGQTGDVAFNAPLQLTVQESPTPSTVGLSVNDKYFLVNGGGQLDLLPTTATDPISYDETDLKIGLKYDKTLTIDENDGKLKVKSGLLKGVKAISIKEDPLAWFSYDFGVDPNFASIELKTDGITLDQSTGVLKCNYQTIPPLNITGNELSLQVDDVTLVAAGEFLRANYQTIPPLAITGNEISLQVDDLTLVAAGPLLKGNYLGMPPIYIGGNEISFHPITGPGIVYADDVLSLDLVGLEGVTIEGNVISCPIVGGEGVLVEFSPIGYVISAIPLLETKRPLLESDPVETTAPGLGPGLMSSQGAILGSGSLVPTIQTTGSVNSVVSAITPDFVGFPFLGSGLPMAIPGTVLGGIASIIGNAAGTQTVTVFGYNPFHLLPTRDSDGNVETEEGNVRPSAVTGGTPTVAIVTDNDTGSTYVLNDPPVDFSPLTWGLTGFGNSLIPNFGMVVQSISNIGGTIFQPILDSSSDIVANSLTISSPPTDGDQATNKSYVDSTISSAVSGLISAPLVLTNTDDSISPETGSLQVAGGAGIGGNLYVGGGIYKGTDPYVTESYLPGRYQPLHENLTLLSQTPQTLGCFLTSSDDSPMDYLMRTPSEARTMLGLGDLALLSSLNLATQVSGTLANSHLASALSSGSLALTDTTASTTSTTGSLVAAGGCGLGGSLFVGGNLNIAGSAVLTGAVTVPTPSSSTHATTKAYVDGISYVTTGTGLTKTGSTLSVNAAQTQITSVGTLSGLAISSSAVIPVSISTSYNSGTAYPVTCYAPSITSNDVLVPIGISSANTSYFGFQYNGSGSASNYASVGVRSNVVVLDPLRVYGDKVTILHTADSTTISTGALQVSGGLGVYKNISVGGNLVVSGDATVTGTLWKGASAYATQSYVSSNFQPLHANLTGISSLTPATNSFVTCTSSSFQTSTPSSVATILGLGALATAANVNLATQVTGTLANSSLPSALSTGSVTTTLTTVSTSTTTGSLVVAGGAGVAGDVYVGGGLNVAGSTTHTGVCTVLAPSSSTDAARKDYVDGISYLTAGIGLTKTGSSLSVNAFLGSLSGFAISSAGQSPASISTTYSSGTAYPLTCYAPSITSNNVLIPVGISSSNTAYFGLMYVGSASASNYASVGLRSNIVSIDPLRVYSDKVTILHTADSTSTSTGSLQISGGLAVVKNVYVGGNMNVTGSVTVPTPSATTDAGRKDYIDGLTYLTAGTGLTKTSSTLSVNAAQTQITSVGTLTSLAVSGTTVLTGALTVLTPSATTDAARKDYVDGLTYLTAGTGLTKTSSTLSVNAAQTQITSVGTLSGLAISGTAQIPASITTSYSSGTAYPISLYAPSVSSNNVLLPIGISSSNTAYFGLMYVGSANALNYASVGVRSNSVAIDPFRVYSDKVTILHTADSTNTSTGALQVSGGLAVTKNLVVGGNFSSVGLNVGGATNLSLGKNVLAGTDSNLAAGPHVCYFTNTDLTYPVFQQLNFSHDNISLGFDWYYDNVNWRTATSTVGFQLYKYGGNFSILRSTGTPSAGASANGTAALSITGSDGSVAIPSTASVTPNMSNLNSSTGGALNVSGDVFVGGKLVVGGTGYSYYGNYEAYSFTGMSNWSTTQSYSILNNYNFYQSPNGQVCVFSDERLKKNGRPVSDATRVVKGIQAKSFEWKCRPGETKHGFFAGDVAPFIPEAIHTTSGSGDIVERVKTVVAYGRRVIIIMPTGTVLEEGDVLSVIDCDEVHHEGVLVESVADDACVELLFREKPNTRQDLLIYGRQLSDVKVLDNSMLVPFLWQAVSDLLERVESLEGGSASGDLNYR